MPENYARFLLDDILDVDYAVYLDLDTIVNADVAVLVDELRQSPDPRWS